MKRIYQLSCFVSVICLFFVLYLLYFYNLSNQAIINKEDQNSGRILRKAMLGDIQAMDSIIKISFPTDKEYSRFWAEKAAKAGSSFALNSLASMYRYGTGGEKNIQKAIKLYIVSANRGNLDSAYNLGIIYLSENNDPTNKTKGINLLKAVCSKGLNKGCEALLIYNQEISKQSSNDEVTNDISDKKKTSNENTVNKTKK